MVKEICLTARTVQHQGSIPLGTVIQQTGRDRKTAAQMVNKWGGWLRLLDSPGGWEIQSFVS